MTTSITNRKHAFVQRCRQLSRRRITGADLVLLDGPHLVAEALAAGATILEAAVDRPFRLSPEGEMLFARLVALGVDTAEVGPAIMEAMSPVRTPAGIVAVARIAPAALNQALEGIRPLVVVALDVQDPGNLGAIVRAAEAGHATGVVCAGDCADPFGWKALRGSMGSAFRIPVTGRIDLSIALEAIRRRGFRVAATSPRIGTNLYETDLTRPMAIVVGSEGAGIGNDVIAQADLRLTIPMKAPVESLNVAVATAIVVFEAYRQRTSGEAPPGSSRTR